MRKYRKSLPNTTPEQFCVWLHEWIEAFNLPIQNQWGWSYPLDPPSCIDIVQGDPPYKIVVKRIQSAPAVIKSVWRNRPSPEYPHGDVPDFRNDSPRRSETPPYNPVALEIKISRVGKGIDVEVDCNDGHRLQLEKFAFALMALETKGQSLAGIVERVQELSQSELTGIPSALRDAIDMEREQKLLALGLTPGGEQPATPTAQTEIDGRPEPEAPAKTVSKGKRGPKPKPSDEVYDIARRYLQVRDRVTQSAFADQYNISVTRLKDYVKLYNAAVNAGEIED